tara:strand:+ start:88 stop:534 length:447 start_codon:yes stop_codon:yes gene_type:complete
MASTLTPTSFNITITEEQIVRNSIVKHEVRQTINNVTNVDHRILTCPVSTSIDLFNINGTNPGAGTFPSSSLKYARITNLDNLNNAAITISGSQGKFTQNLTPESSIFLSNSNITSSNFDGNFGDDILFVQVYAMTGSVDIEYTLVNA